MDRLSTLLAQFGMHATTIFGGELQAELGFDVKDRTAKLHLLRAGDALLQLGQQQPITISEPSLVFLPRPCSHNLRAAPVSSMESQQQVELVSAALCFDGGLDNPLTMALPAYVLVPLADIPMLSGNLDWLFGEAFAQHCGKNAVLNRLFELVVIQLLRHMMASSSVASGMMAGLADLRLAKAVTLMHDQPAKAWSVN
jgi:hypothetical protein